MLKIGDFSKLSRISIRMLRHYDEMGLLHPVSVDAATGYRYYGESQLPDAGRIRALRDMGFSLAMIGELTERCRDAESLRAFLSLRRAEIGEQMDALRRQSLLLENALTQLGKDDVFMNYSVTLKELPGRYVASLRQVIPAYDQEQLLWNQLNAETAHLSLQPADPPYGLAVFHDEGFVEHDADVEIQITVKGRHENTEHVIFKDVPPVLVASATYQGSYDQLYAANAAVANWVRDNGYDFDGASFCIYHVSPAETDNPDELVTEVCYPVRKHG